nr:MAG TPA: hypothetical protein [Caudoviricetes sp.]
MIFGSNFYFKRCEFLMIFCDRNTANLRVIRALI